jgi:O-acetylserine/cysteine efflux transporter
MLSRAAGQINMIAYVVWSSLFAVPVLLTLALLFEGREAVSLGLQNAGPLTWLAVAWQAWGNSIFGYAAWGWLLSRYTAATITPMALMVPLFGMGASALWLGESMPDWKLVAAALVLGGLTLNLLWPRLRSMLGTRSP